MKRYWVEPFELDEIKMGDDDVEVILFSEVEAELAKKDEEIKKLNVSLNIDGRTLAIQHAEIARLQEEIKLLIAPRDVREKSLISEVARLRKALEFYAETKMWSTTVKTAEELSIIAREALEWRE